MEPQDVPILGWDEVIGLTYDVVTDDRVAARFAVRPELLDSTGVLHRGAVSSAVESVGSVAAASWYGQRGHVVGVANSTSHFRQVRDGAVTVVATPVARQDARQLWAVDVLDSDDELVAHGELAVANIRDAGGLARRP
jgi:1,4-dihydroxy-2-naphthoyl-CoA hydrolase